MVIGSSGNGSARSRWPAGRQRGRRGGRLAVTALLAAAVAGGRPLLAQIVGPGTTQRDSTPVERRVGATYVLERAGRLDEAATQYRAHAREAIAQRDSVGEAAAEYRLGILFWGRSRHDSALVHLETARAIRGALPDRVEFARVLNGIGATYYQLGIYEPALEAFLEAEAIRRERKDSIGLARTLTNVGKTYHDWGQLARGEAKLREAIAVASRASEAGGPLGYAWNSLALLAIDAGQYDSAATFIQRSLAAYAIPGVLKTRADSIDAWEFNTGARGALALRRGAWRAAALVLDSVVTSARARGSVRGLATALVRLGESEVQLGQVNAGRGRFREALQVSRSGGQRLLALEALRHLASAEESAGGVARALAFLKQYQALRDTVFAQDAALRIAAREARAEVDEARRETAALQVTQRSQALTISRQRLAMLTSMAVVAIVCTLIVLLVRARGRERARSADLTAANADLARLNDDLRTAMAEVRRLSGLIPICANCKRVRDDRGYWQAVETFVSSRSEATFSHSICQTCGPTLYGDLWEQPPDPAFVPGASTNGA